MPTDEEGEIVKALLAGRVVPVIGLDGGGRLAEHLARAFEVPDDRPVDLARISQYVATMQGSGPLYDELHSRFEAAVEPGPLHRFLAGSRRCSASAVPRISSSSRPTTTSRSSEPSRRPARSSTSSPTSRRGHTAGASGTGRRGSAASHRRPEHVRDGAEPRDRTILLKLHGAVDPLPEREWESFVITEDDYIDYLGRSELTAVVPVRSPRGSGEATSSSSATRWPTGTFASSSTGSGASDPSAYRSWAVQRSPSPLAQAFWRRFDVAALDVDPQSYVELLERRLEAA